MESIVRELVEIADKHCEERFQRAMNQVKEMLEFQMTVANFQFFVGLAYAEPQVISANLGHSAKPVVFRDPEQDEGEGVQRW